MLSGTQTNAMTVRRFDGVTFAAPVQVLPSGEDIHSWLAQDPAGRLHAVIPQGAADGIHLVHATSDDGAAWRSGTVLVQTDGGIFDVRSAVAADHVGVAVWSTSVITGPRAGTKEIRVAAIGPDAPGSAVRPQAGLPRGSKPPATAVRLPDGSVRVVVKGALRRPAGVSRSRGCRGTVRVRFKRGKRTIGAKTVKVTQTCAFRRTLRARRVQDQGGPQARNDRAIQRQRRDGARRAHLHGEDQATPLARAGSRIPARQRLGRAVARNAYTPRLRLPPPCRPAPSL